LAERGIIVSYETVRRWVNHFGPKFAANVRKRRPKARHHLASGSGLFEDTIDKLDEVIGQRCAALANQRDAIKCRTGFRSRPKITTPKCSAGDRITGAMEA
jgi:hypothetical protein